MGLRTVWRVRQGSLLLHPKTGAVVAYAGEDVADDHPVVLAHPSIGSDCYRVEVEDAPFDPSKAPSSETTPAADAPVVLLCDTDPALGSESS